MGRKLHEEELLSIRVTYPTMVSFRLKQHITNQTEQFFGGKPLEEVPVDYWLTFAAACAHIYSEEAGRFYDESISRSAVDQLMTTMADLGVEEKKAIEQETVTKIIEGLQSFVDSEPSLGAQDQADVEGVKRAIEIVKVML